MFDQNVTSPFTTTVTTPSQTQAQKPLRDSVKQAVNKYLKQLDNANIDNLYEMVLAEVEAPLLEEVMTYTRGNQTRAAIMMGTKVVCNHAVVFSCVFKRLNSKVKTGVVR